MNKKIVAMLLVGVMSVLLIACSGEKPDQTQKSSTTEKSESNTSEKVDEILLKAKNDAETISDSDAESKWEEAFDYLKEHSENFYENNEVMEKSMYYGEYIYRYIETNANAKDISQLEDSTRAAYDAGYNTVKAIKYVYRNAATTEDDDTKAALIEAQNALNKFK